MSLEICPPTAAQPLTPEQLAKWCERVRDRREQFVQLDLSDRTHLHQMGLIGPWADQVLAALDSDDPQAAGAPEAL